MIHVYHDTHSTLHTHGTHLHSRDAGVDALDDLLGDSDGVHEARVQAVAELW